MIRSNQLVVFCIIHATNSICDLRSASELESVKMKKELMMNKNSTLFKKFTK